MFRRVCLLVWVATSASGQVTTTFRNGAGGYTGIRDVAIVGEHGEPWNPNTNHEGLSNWIDGSPTDEGTLMRFDVSAIPSSATVDSVTLTLTIGDGTRSSYALYALRRSWVVTEATWNRATSTQPWQVAGAQGATDRASTAGATFTGTGTVSQTLNATGRAMVQAWVTTPASNFGFTLQDYSLSDGTDIHHCDFATVSSRPQLTVGTNQGDFVFRNGVSPLATYAGCTDVAIGNGVDPVITNWDDSSAFELDADKTILMSVDLGTIPPWASVVGASLTVAPVSDSTSSFDAYELSRSWAEGEATWVEASSGITWDQQGATGPGDHSATSMGTWVAPGAARPTFVFEDAGVAVFERWVRVPLSNFGFALQNRSAPTSFRFDESESSTVASRPLFSVTWFEGRLGISGGPASTDQPLPLTLSRARLDAVAIDTGAPALPVVLTTTAPAQLSVDGGSWATSAVVTIPDGTDQVVFYLLRSSPGSAELGADAGPGWLAVPVMIGFTDAGSDAGSPDAGALAADAGAPPAALNLAVGCGCDAAPGAELVLLLAFCARRLSLRSGGACRAPSPARAATGSRPAGTRRWWGGARPATPRAGRSG